VVERRLCASRPAPIVVLNESHDAEAARDVLARATEEHTLLR